MYSLYVSPCKTERRGFVVAWEGRGRAVSPFLPSASSPSSPSPQTLFSSAQAPTSDRKMLLINKTRPRDEVLRIRADKLLFIVVSLAKTKNKMFENFKTLFLQERFIPTYQIFYFQPIKSVP